jgi:hypothetical protein
MKDLVDMVMNFERRFIFLVEEIIVSQRPSFSIEFISCYDCLQEHEYHFAVGIQ